MPFFNIALRLDVDADAYTFTDEALITADKLSARASTSTGTISETTSNIHNTLCKRCNIIYFPFADDH